MHTTFVSVAVSVAASVAVAVAVAFAFAAKFEASVDIFKRPSHEVNSDDVVVVSSLSPSDNDFDHEQISGEDGDHDHGDNPIETDVVVPVDELKKKIVRQVEYYFSDENLSTDKFLLSAMKRNKKGFVPISTIATFDKIKKLTRDHALIVAALKESSFLVVRADGKMVKRLSPLPEIRDPKFFTVLVENLPEDHSDENIREIFGKAGSIKSVSICDPNAAEESEKGWKKDKFIRTRLHAFVEYETVEAAEKAAATLNNDQDWRNGLRVKLLEQADGGNHQKDKNGNKGRGGQGGGRGRRQNHQGGNGHGTVEVSKRPPGPRMPDGTRGFTMGRGQVLPPPPTSTQASPHV